MYANPKLDPDDDLLSQWWLIPAVCLITLVILLTLWTNTGNASGVSKDQAVSCIIGEAEDQGFEGMLAVAQALDNRGTINGVYGCNAKRVKNRLYSSYTFVQAVKAYEEAKKHPRPELGSGWGNSADLVLFKRSAWWKKCHVTTKIKSHYFYSCNQ